MGTNEKRKNISGSDNNKCKHPQGEACLVQGIA